MLQPDATREVDDGLGLLTLAVDGDDRPRTERRMFDLIPDMESEFLAVGRLGNLPAGTHGGVDDPVLVLLLLSFDVSVDVDAAGAAIRLVPCPPIRRRVGAVRRTAFFAVALTPVRRAPRHVAFRLDQFGGDLVEEARRRVVLGGAEQLPAPRV